MTNDLAHDLSNERPHDAIVERIAELVQASQRWQSADLWDEEIARRAADYFNQVRGLKQRLEDARKAEKAPALALGKEIDQRYAAVGAPLEGVWEMISDKIKNLLSARKSAGKEPRLYGNYSNRAIALRTIRRVEIFDYDALLAYYANREEVFHLLEKLANAELIAPRDGHHIPGCNIIEKEIVA